MSTIKSSNEHLTFNADGTSKEIRFQANGTQKASISSAGLFTSTTIDATKLTGTIPNFRSTGIDDNADAIAITIDSSENVGIGVTPESWLSIIRALQIGGNGSLSCDTSAGAGKTLSLGNNVYHDGARKYISTDEATRYDQNDGKHTFFVSPSGTADSAISWTTAMTIDNSGNVTVGTGNLEIGTIGVVGKTANDVNIYSTDSGHNGLRMHVNGILPTDNTGTIVDADADLGDPSYRFKDLYLSGGLKVGGTGTANTLDDYEEGTWTPTTNGGSWTITTHKATYTKIGNLVSLQFYFEVSNGVASRIEIGGMPFATYNNGYNNGSADTNTLGHVGTRTQSSASYFIIKRANNNSWVNSSEVNGGHVIGNIVYHI